jgi:hypothetical protein
MIAHDQLAHLALDFVAEDVVDHLGERGQQIVQNTQIVDIDVQILVGQLDDTHERPTQT